MGYRHYMYIVPRNVVNEVKNLTYDEQVEYANKHDLNADKESSWSILRSIFGDEVFFNFGKYYENAEEIQKLSTPLFSLSSTQECFEEYDPYIVEKEGVLCAIEHYRRLIINWYSDLLLTQEEYDATHESWGRQTKQEERIKKHLENQKEEWENCFGITAIDIDMESPKIVKSWLYEYEIIELVHQLKTMDWERNVLLFYGW